MRRFIIAALLLASVPCRAVEMCWIFDSGMVLQAERPVSVWGQGTPGEEVTVWFAGQTKTTKAGSDGEWAVKLDP